MNDSIQLIALCATVCGIVLAFVRWQNGRLDKIYNLVNDLKETIIKLSSECEHRGKDCPVAKKPDDEK